jgi:hypothetical protein
MKTISPLRSVGTRILAWAWRLPEQSTPKRAPTEGPALAWSDDTTAQDNFSLTQASDGIVALQKADRSVHNCCQTQSNVNRGTVGLG